MVKVDNQIAGRLPYHRYFKVKIRLNMRLFHRLFPFVVFTIVFVQLHAQGKTFKLESPGKNINIVINLADKIYYSISADGEDLVINNPISLGLRTDTLGQTPKLIKAKSEKGSELIKPYITLKYASVQSKYSSLVLSFKGDYIVEFRAFDDGVAYRFVSSRKGEIEVMNEDFALHFPAEYLLHLQQPVSFNTSYEEAYTHVSSGSWKITDKMSTLPILVDTKKQHKILISESDLSDYPAMFLKGTGNNGVQGSVSKDTTGVWA